MRTSLEIALDTLIEKGKAYPVGFINKYNEIKMPDGTWKYMSKSALAKHYAGGKDNKPPTKSKVGFQISSETTSGTFNPGDTNTKSGVKSIKIGDGEWMSYDKYLASWGGKVPTGPEKYIGGGTTQIDYTMGMDQEHEDPNLISQGQKGAKKLFKQLNDSFDKNDNGPPQPGSDAWNIVMGIEDEHFLDAIKYNIASEGIHSKTGSSMFTKLLEDMCTKEYESVSESQIRDLAKKKNIGPDSEHAWKRVLRTKSDLASFIDGLQGALRPGSNWENKLDSKNEYDYSEEFHSLYKDLQGPEFSIIKSYTGTYYQPINRMLAGKVPLLDNFPITKKVFSLTTALFDGALDKITFREPKKGVTYRGYGGGSYAGAKEEIQKTMVDHFMNIGNTTKFGTFISTSELSSGTLNDHSSAIVYVTSDVKTGKSVKLISSHKSESEFIYPTTAKFKVNKVVKSESAFTHQDADHHTTNFIFMSEQ